MARITGRKLLLVSCATVAIVTGIASNSRAEDLHSYNIEQQDLASALRKFAQISGTDLIFPPELVRGKRTSGVKGTYPDDEVLKYLLAGTGLAAAKTANGALVLRVSPIKISAPADEMRPIVIAQATPPAAPEPQTAQAAPIEEVVVTGSRIIRDGYQAPTPLTVVGTDELQQMANPNIADAINKMPEFMGSVRPSTSTSNLSSGSAGVNELNLRGMGAQRTLVLLDGQRQINSGLANGFVGVDINAIPQGLVSRVDVVTGGASAAYGSDALTGVVNFVLDKNFTGVKGDLEGGVTTYGDNRSYQVNLTAGFPFANGRGHVLIYGEDAWNGGIQSTPRAWDNQGGSVVVNPNWTATNGQPYYQVLRQVGIYLGTPGGLITSGPLKGIYFGPGGTPLQFNYGLNGGHSTMIGGDWQSSATFPGVDLEPALARDNAFLRLSYDITDTFSIHTDGAWTYAHENTNSDANATLADITILSGNPFIPASVQAQMTALKVTSLLMGSTNADAPRFHSNNFRTTRRGDIGADGKFDAVGSTWTWSAYAQLTEEDIHSETYSVANTANLALAYDAVRTANGGITCRSTLTNPSNGCVPYNVFGIGVNSQAAISYGFGTPTADYSLRQVVDAVNVNGEPFSIWAGPVSVALGLEHRYERAASLTDAADNANVFVTGNYHDTHGHYMVTEGYLETVVPLAKGERWAQAWDLNAAIRATDYSTSGYVTTWKIGTTYSPIDDLRFRATRSRDIRAPFLGELFSAGTAGSGNTFNDPFTNTTTTLGFSLSQGNPNLKPEKADTTGVGVVVQPSFFPGFSGSVDFYDISIGNAIEVPAAQSVINGCYAGTTALCSDISRVNGVISTVITQPSNILAQVEHGFDFEASYRFALSSIVDSWEGDISIRGLATLLTELTNVDLQYGNVNGLGVLGGFGGTGFAGLTAQKFRSTATVSYVNASVSTALTMRYIAGGVYNNAYTQCTSGCPGTQFTIDNNRIGSNTLFDLALAYRPFESNKNIETYLTIQNLLNTDPPFIGGTATSTYYAGMGNAAYDRIGRQFFMGVRFKM